MMAMMMIMGIVVVMPIAVELEVVWSLEDAYILYVPALTLSVYA